MQNLIPVLEAAEKSKKYQGAQRTESTIFCLTLFSTLPGGDFFPLYARARARFGR